MVAAAGSRSARFTAASSASPVLKLRPGQRRGAAVQRGT